MRDVGRGEAVLWLLRVVALSLLVLTSMVADQGHVIAAGLAFVGLCCLRDS